MKMATQILGSPCRKVGALGGGSARAQAGHQLLDVRPQASERSISQSNASEGHKNPRRSMGFARLRSKKGPRRKAGLQCGCRAPSLARKDGLCSSAE